MTRFGMGEHDFEQIADYISRVVLKDRSVGKEVSKFRNNFTEMKYCLSEKEVVSLIKGLFEAVS